MSAQNTFVAEGERRMIARLAEFDAAQAEAMRIERLHDAAQELLSIARRWVALDGGSWHVVRHASDKAQLLADTAAVIAKTEGSQS